MASNGTEESDAPDDAGGAGSAHDPVHAAGTGGSDDAAGTDAVGARSRKPVVLAVDDEPAVLAAIARDLRREYGDEYRVLRAGSGEAALELLRELKLRGDAVALLVVDQRMPGMTGIELLAAVRELYPETKRVLLTAYADTAVAIRAINEIRLDHYLLKPWDPPEERLYPVLTDLLDDWRANVPQPFDGVRVVGHRWSRETHAIKDFLARNLVPFQWLDIEGAPEAEELVQLAGAGPGDLPLVLLPDGTRLVRPAPAQIGARIGLRMAPAEKFYDVVIVGAGPAGLAAAVYGGSEGLRTVLIESHAPGGQAGLSAAIENYLGFPAGLSGSDLARRAVAQATRFGAEILTPLEVRGLRAHDTYRFVQLGDGSEIACHTVLISTGVSYRRLDVPGAARLTGAGVYYGSAITEGRSTAGQDVAVVGAGNSAGQAAVYLARHARRIFMIVRGGSLTATMSSYLIAQIQNTPNIHVRFDSQLQEVHGERNVEGVTVRTAGETEILPVQAVFVFIGAVPPTEWVGDSVARDPQGFIFSGPDLPRDPKGPLGWKLRREPYWLETTMPGVFVAGDVRHRSVKRIASAVGEGSMAVQFIHQYLGSL